MIRYITAIIAALIITPASAATKDISIPVRNSSNVSINTTIAHITSGTGVVVYRTDLPDTINMGTMGFPYLSPIANTLEYDNSSDSFGISDSHFVWLNATYAPIAHNHAWSDIISGTPTTLSGYGITDPVVLTSGSYANPSWITSVDWSKVTNAPSFLTAEVDGSVTNEIELPPQSGQSGKVLSTDGTSPSWISASTGTVTNVTAGAGLSGGSITGSGTISMPNIGSPGTYSSVTTDAQGRVTSGTSIQIGSTSRSIVTSTSSTGFQVDASRNSLVSYDIDMSTTTTIGGPSSVVVYLETANTNSSSPTDWSIVGKVANGQSVSLALTLQSVQTSTANLSKVIPAGNFVRIRSASSGTASASISISQETKL